MQFFRQVANFLGIKNEQQQLIIGIDEERVDGAPMEAGVEAGRSSQSETELYSSISAIIRPRDFDPQILQYIRHLAYHNRHVSKAVENVVSTAHTPVSLKLSDYYSDRQKREIQMHLEARQAEWYYDNEGESSLDADRFAQVAVFGACSTEAEIKSDLSGIRKIHRVSPEYIRWYYDRNTREEYPVQLTTASTNASFAYTELNRIQYDYIAYRRIGGSSYAVPPFLAALEDIARELNMLDNFSGMMKRIGLLGFLSVMVEKPAQKKGTETDQQYLQRLRDYLKQIEPQVRNGFYKGYNIGYEGSHKFEVQGNSANARGASELMEIANKLVFAGLKQDPNLFGYNYSTTETFGKVIMEMMSKQAQGYQMVVAKDKTNKACLELMLAGFSPIPEQAGKFKNPYGLEYDFDKPLNVDKDKEAETEKKKAEAESLRISNTIKKRDEGIISQQQAASELGYKKPDQATVRSQQNQLDVSWRAKRNERIRKKLGAELPEYQYQLPNSGCGKSLDFEFDGFEGDEQLSALYSSYYGKVKENYLRVLESSAVKLYNDISELSEDSSIETIWALFEQRILEAWRVEFQEPNRDVIHEEVNKAYQLYREDQSIFHASKQHIMEFSDIPEASLDLLDLRAIKYLEELDNLYLGKFITDESTRRKFKTWLNDMYLDGNVPVGRAGEELEAFLEEFGEVFAYESYKIARVISTTLNKARNYANVLYINQANLEKFEIVEVMDRITCQWCRHLNGKQFTTAKAVSKIERAINSSTRDIGKESPFATSIPLEEFEQMETEQIQNRGIDTPPYHCHCRGRVVAVQ